MVRSVMAVLAGLVVLTGASFAIEALVNQTLPRILPGSFPDQPALDASVSLRLFMIVYTMLSITLGGYVTARWAPQNPVRHAVAMGVVELIMTIVVMLKFFSTAPLWGWLVGSLLIVPSAWCGARLRVLGQK